MTIKRSQVRSIMVKGIRRRSANDSTTSIDSTSSSSPTSLTPLNYRRPYLYLDTSVGSCNDPAAIVASWTDSILQSATSTCWHEEDYPPARGQLAAPWTEWTDTGIEFFGCEGDGTDERKHLSGRTTLLQQKSDSQLPSLLNHGPGNQPCKDGTNSSVSVSKEIANQDYAKLHEEFFESLLKEQGDLAEQIVLQKSQSHESRAASSVSSGLSSVSSATMESYAAPATLHSETPDTTVTRHRSLQMHRLSTRGRNKKKKSDAANSKNRDLHHHHARIAPIEAYNQKFNPSLTPNEEASVAFPEISAKDALHGPLHYVHPQCLLQKDRGRGDDPKTSISAVGRDSCLEKLRDKMRLVVQVTSEERKASTGMKRRVAKVSGVTRSYVETRSMIEMQLGFLSMQYGLLLHWDTMDTGKISYICLRKMCHDSFYSKIPALAPNGTILREPKQSARKVQKHREFFSSTRSSILPTTKKSPAPPLVVRTRRGNHAIYQRCSGATEVVLVSSPYRVPQPEVFAPSVLTVDIHQITGLERTSEWTLSITFHGQSDFAHLQYNDDRKVFETTRAIPCKWEMMVPHQITSFDVSGLEIRLFEHRKQSQKNALGGNRSGTSNNGTNQSVASSCSNSSSQPISLNVSGRSQQLVRGGMKTSKKSSSRLASTMTIPLGGLVSQPCTSQTTLWKLTMPFTHDEHAQVTFTLVHQSDYAHWLYQELRARRKEMGAASSLLAARKGGPLWTTSLLSRWGVSRRSTNDRLMVYDSDDEHDEVVEPYLIDWLNGICCK